MARMGCQISLVCVGRKEVQYYTQIERLTPIRHPVVLLVHVVALPVGQLIIAES